MAKKNKEKTTLTHQLLNILGVLMCIILIPILIINCTLLFKGYTNKNEVPNVNGVFPMIVLTDSMSGIFESGDLIICKTIDPQDIKVDDVITFFDPASNGSAVVTHRVLEINENDNQLSFVTKGDANNVKDAKEVPEANIIGIYNNMRIPGAGNIAMFMQTTTGLIVCVVLPLILMIGYDTMRRNQYNKKHQNDKEELLKELEELRQLKQQMKEPK